MIRTSILQFYPETLDKVINKKYPTFWWNNTELKTAYIVDIVHNLILRYYMDKINYFNLSSLILREKYGHLYNTYMDFLISKDVIRLESNYMVGLKTKSYSLNPKMINCHIDRYQSKDKVIVKKYNRNVNAINLKDIETNLIQHSIKKILVSHLFHINIDKEKAMYFLNNTKQERDILSRNKYSVDSIFDKHIFYHFDDYGRFHTNYTILKSFIRKNCLTIGGEEVYEIDIKNSQPLFLMKLIEDRKSKWVSKDEFELFRYLTVNGLWYQYLMDQLGIKDKKLVKEMTYKVFFGKNYNSKYDKLFCSLFPTIYNFIKLYKKDCDDYRGLSHKLQKMESEFLFNNVIKRVLEKYPDIVLFTVHDSIVIPRSYKEGVKNIFTELFNREFKQTLVEII